MMMRIRSLFTDCSGAVTVVFAVAAVLLLGIAGLAIDHGRATSLQTRMQTALDSAVLAGLMRMENLRETTARNVFEDNLGRNDAASVALTFSSPSANEYSGSAHLSLQTGLSSVLGIGSLDVSVVSTAVRGQSGRVCMLVLDTSASQALLVNNGATVIAPDCEIHVKSAGSPAAVFNAGTNLSTAGICIEGSNIIDNGGAHPNMQTNCRTAGDPFAGTLPEPASAVCDENNRTFNGGTVNLRPGVYCGWTNFNSQPDVTLDPGVYVIRGGGWNVDGGTWTGNGVVFFFADQSKIQFNNAVAATLTPPASGPYRDVIIFEKGGLARSPFVLDDSRGMNISGLIYLPSRDTIFNSASNLTSKRVTVVVNTLILDETNWSVEAGSHEIATAGGSSGPARISR